MTKKELTKIYKDYNLTKEDIFQDRRGFVIITRSGIEKIQLDKNIQVEFEVICCSLDNVVIKATSYLQGQDGEWLRQMETFGSASIKNCNQNFKVEIAEKRALARVIIKTIGLTNAYSEDELKHQP
tara:strand:- start:2108 stop:2485 length:378 start_codon:yes stop_codon:yes gene_type:complete